MEKLMQYVWQHRLWSAGAMRTDDGRTLSVIDQGRLNTGSGPDFFKASVKVGDQQWVGDIEIHVRASDWHRHHHDGDPAYDSVVLHVVGISDCRIQRSNGEEIPQFTMPCSPDFNQRYSSLVDNRLSALPCGSELASLPSIYKTDWIQALAMERLFAKSDRFLDCLKRCEGDWRQAVYVTTARALGFKTNAQPFERVAYALPLKILLKHRNSPEAVEGMLFGTSGLLDDPRHIPASDPATSTPESAYIARLQAEYRFMTAKFGLHALASPGWKLGSIRPQNSPYRRLAALSALVREGFTLADRLLNVESPADAHSLFDVELIGFWATHYSPTSPSASAPKVLSKASLDSLTINVVCPILHAYGRVYDDATRRERAVDLLQSIRPEQNYITRQFSNAGLTPRSAFSSQALIQLRTDYCDARKCLYCRFGHRLLAARVAP